MTSQFKYDRKDVMSQAWLKANRRANRASERTIQATKYIADDEARRQNGRVVSKAGKYATILINEGIQRQAKEFIAVAMVDAWNEAKDAMEEARTKEEEERQAETAKFRAKKHTQRYIELASRAVAARLSHGKTWIADGFNVDRFSLPPEWEGAAICYVYPE